MPKAKAKPVAAPAKDYECKFHDIAREGDGWRVSAEIIRAGEAVQATAWIEGPDNMSEDAIEAKLVEVFA